MTADTESALLDKVCASVDAYVAREIRSMHHRTPSEVKRRETLAAALKLKGRNGKMRLLFLTATALAPHVPGESFYAAMQDPAAAKATFASFLAQQTETQRKQHAFGIKYLLAPYFTGAKRMQRAAAEKEADTYARPDNLPRAAPRKRHTYRRLRLHEVGALLAVLRNTKWKSPAHRVVMTLFVRMAIINGMRTVHAASALVEGLAASQGVYHGVNVQTAQRSMKLRGYLSLLGLHALIVELQGLHPSWTPSSPLLFDWSESQPAHDDQTAKVVPLTLRLVRCELRRLGRTIVPYPLGVRHFRRFVSVNLVCSGRTREEVQATLHHRKGSTVTDRYIALDVEDIMDIGASLQGRSQLMACSCGTRQRHGLPHCIGCGAPMPRRHGGTLPEELAALLSDEAPGG